MGRLFLLVRKDVSKSICEEAPHKLESKHRPITYNLGASTKLPDPIPISQ